jgi:hypothetical protein
MVSPRSTTPIKSKNIRFTVLRKIVLFLYMLTTTYFTIFLFPFIFKGQVGAERVGFIWKTEEKKFGNLSEPPVKIEECGYYTVIYKCDYKFWLFELFLITLFYGTIFILLPNKKYTIDNRE